MQKFFAYFFQKKVSPAEGNTMLGKETLIKTPLAVLQKKVRLVQLAKSPLSRMPQSGAGQATLCLVEPSIFKS